MFRHISEIRPREPQQKSQSLTVFKSRKYIESQPNTLLPLSSKSIKYIENEKHLMRFKKAVDIAKKSGFIGESMVKKLNCHEKKLTHINEMELGPYTLILEN